MTFFSGQQIRDTWIRFFKDKGHAIEPSFSLIPHNDNTLLWINAGLHLLRDILMEEKNQIIQELQTFKNVFEPMILIM